MRIDYNKLPVKYALEVYQELPGYPTAQDKKYILLRVLEEANLLETPFSSKDVWKGMKNCIPTLESLEEFLASLENDEECKVVKEKKL